ncbi:hypothetical protein SAMN05660860_01153 [Geoalkalibacter ferrihydriticus]|uniref:Lipoprotein n=2 Tax=Geoalkalibacter ferrihydriticus TaxID=392333 RepID=A0A0C2HS87_9BACT|nr:hypothetical protein [Geoalkalibacter ferrihydriticus]KIH77685.1 hypothetical protein GFER_03195 [Geoalkalibacter ferrihydriticus DSM 17813]SDL73692.1 hypothetical protein SAMN05660860_01153 [Geoalkalibacter ferrihydriticus]
MLVRFVLTMALLLTVSACAPQPVVAPVEDAAFSAHGITKIAVQPVVVRDWTPRGFCERDVENRLRFSLVRALEGKGYEVTRVAREAPRYVVSSDPLVDETADNVLAQVPSGVDAVLMLWVDHYQSFGLCDAVRHPRLELEATAVLYSVAQRAEIWRNRALVGDFTSNDPVLYVTYELPRRLLITLPDR